MDLGRIAMGKDQAARANALVVRMRTEHEEPFADGYCQGTRLPSLGQQLATNPKFFLRRVYQLRLHVAKVTRVGDEPGEPAVQINAVAAQQSIDGKQWIHRLSFRPTSCGVSTDDSFGTSNQSLNSLAVNFSCLAAPRSVMLRN